MAASGVSLHSLQSICLHATLKVLIFLDGHISLVGWPATLMRVSHGLPVGLSVQPTSKAQLLRSFVTLSRCGCLGPQVE